MTPVLILLVAQIAMGAFDNLWHHEITERLPAKRTARLELALHATREFIYAVIFLGIAWARWEGAWAWVLAGLLAVELAVTLWDFVVEDATRRLPRLERITHTVLAINLGGLFAVWGPQIAESAAAPTGFAAADYGLFSWFLALSGIGVFAWAVRDLVAVVRMAVPPWQAAPMRAGCGQPPRTVLVTGATGFIGRALVRALIERGNRVIALSRDPANARELFGPLVEVCGDLGLIDSGRRIHAIVNLAGAPLAGGLWTRGRKRQFVASRVATTEAVLELIGRLHRQPKVLVSGSAIGFYGDRGDTRLEETAGPQPMFLSALCQVWETAAQRAEAMGVRVVRLRTGFVLGRDGGALPPLALSARLGAGAVLGSGRQFLSWIHRDDLVRLITFALDTPDLRGAVNAAAPFAATQREFMTTLARALHRRVRLRVPAPLLRFGLGELSDLFLASQRVIPAAATAAGFRFRFEILEHAFADLFGKASASPLAAADAGPVTVFFNDACPVCNTEMTHYRRVADASAVDFRAISADPRSLEAYGLGEADIRRRLFVFDRAGRLPGGVDAFVAIWREMPRYRWAARLAQLPGLHGVLSAIYDAALAPALALFNRWRSP